VSTLLITQRDATDPEKINGAELVLEGESLHLPVGPGRVVKVEALSPRQVHELVAHVLLADPAFDARQAALEEEHAQRLEEFGRTMLAAMPVDGRIN
jgi:hypothetical protein